MSDKTRWTAVDDYIHGRLIAPDPGLENALSASDAADLMPISVTAAQGKLLHILALSIGAEQILEIGTLGGYSAIWLARALPVGGKLTTLEINPETAKVATSNLAKAGLADRAQVIVGPAIASLENLEGPFDLVFIDANKDATPAYFVRALELTRKGGLIVVDNVVRDGRIVDTDNLDPNLVGIRQFLETAGKDDRVTVTAIQTVGEKGYDGFAIARVN